MERQQAKGKQVPALDTKTQIQTDEGGGTAAKFAGHHRLVVVGTGWQPTHRAWLQGSLLHAVPCPCCMLCRAPAACCALPLLMRAAHRPPPLLAGMCSKLGGTYSGDLVPGASHLLCRSVLSASGQPKFQHALARGVKVGKSEDALCSAHCYDLTGAWLHYWKRKSCSLVQLPTSL